MNKEKNKKKIRKKYLKKVFSKIGVFMMTLIVTLSNFPLGNMINVNAASADYSFSPRFISGVTTTEKVNASAYDVHDEDLWNTSTGSITAINPNTTYWTRLTTSNQHSNLGIRYNNVGTYNGQIVDMTITVDVEYIVPSPQTYDGRANYPGVGFYTTKIGVHAPNRATGNIKTTCKFYVHGTNTPISVKGHFSLTDIDGEEKADVKSCSAIVKYVRGSCIKDNGTYIYSPSSDEDIHGTSVQGDTQEHWLTCFFAGSSFYFMYGHMYDDKECSAYNPKNRSIYQFLISGSATLEAFDTPNLLKSTSTNSILLGNSYQYSFSTTIPAQPSGKKYTSLSIKDTLQNDITLANNTLTVKDDGNKNVSSYFTLSQSGQTVTISCNDASWLANSSNANKTYTFTINVKPKTENYTFSPGSNGVMVSNKATITTNYGTKESNTVSTEIKFKVDTKLTGKGTITGVTGSNGGTGLITNIKGGTSQTVSWQTAEDYYVKSVKIDGVAQTVGQYVTSGSYTFSNIKANHSVEVVTEEIKYKIDTKLTGKGTITGVTGSNGGTGGLTGLKVKSTHTINWKAADNYYVSSVKIDGVSQTINGYVTSGSKTFSNITSNHSVEVVTLPRPQFIISKSTAESYYNAGDTVTFNISFKLKDNTADKAYNVKLEDIGLTSGVTLDKNSIKVTGLDSSRYEAYTSVKDDADEMFVVEIPVLNKGVTVNITYQGKVENDYVVSLDETKTNNIYNTARVTSDGIVTTGNDSTWESATSTTPVLKPVIEIIKESDKTTYNVGDEVTYQIHVRQTKANAIANEVVVSDKDYTDGIKMTLNSKSDVKVLDVNGNPLDKSLYEVTITNNESFTVKIKSVEYNNPITISVKGVITDQHLAGSTISNKAEASCENNPKEVTATTTSIVYKPNLTITKDADRANHIYNVGDNVIYTVKISQTVNGARANNVVITDTIPEGLTLNADSFNVYKGSTSDANKLTSGYTLTNSTSNTWTMNIDNITTNCYIVYSVKIDEPTLIGRDDIKNIVTTQAANFFDQKDENGTTTYVPKTVKDDSIIEIAKPNLEVKKNTGKDIYNVGDTIDYTITVEQTEKLARANDVKIYDKLGTSGIKFKTDSILTVKTIDGKVLTATTSNDKNFANGDYYVSKRTDDDFEIVLKELNYGKIVISCEAYIEDGNLAGKKVTNTTSVSATNFLRKLDDETFEEIVREAAKDIILPKPEIQIEKVADAEEYNVKDTINYTVTVSETTENARANDVVVTDTLPNGVVLNANSVKVSVPATVTPAKDNKSFTVALKEGLTESFTITYSVYIEDCNLAGKTITNTATVNWSNNPDRDLADYEIPEGTETSKILLPIVDVNKTSDAEEYNVKDTVNYTVTVSETSEKARANDVVVTDTLPEGVVLNADSIKVSVPATVTPAKDGKTFTVALKEGLTESFTITYSAYIEDGNLAGKTITNTTTADWSNNPNNDKPTGEETDNVLLPKIEIVKNSAKRAYNVKDTVNYTVTVSETSEKARANDVVVTDTLPEGVVLNADSIKVSTSVAAFATITPASDNKSFTVALKQGLTESFTITYSAYIEDGNLAGKKITNTATANWSNNPNNDKPTGEETDNVLLPKIEIVKNSVKRAYNVKDTIIYTVTVSETTENARANDIVVTDTLPDGVVLNANSVKVSVPATVTPAKDNKSFTVALKQGLTESFTITYFAYIEDGNLAGKTITNIATADWSNNPNNDTPIGKENDNIYLPVLEVSKTIGDKNTIYNVGDIANYQIVVKQKTRYACANDVVISDRMLVSDIDIDVDSIKIYNGENTSETSLLVEGRDYKIINQYDESTNKSGFDIKLDSLTDAVTITYKAKINNNSVAGKAIKNIVTATASNNQKDKPSVIAEKAIPEPVISVNKETSKEHYNIGDIASFTITATQTVSDAIANDVVIEDTMIENGVEIDYNTINVEFNNKKLMPNVDFTLVKTEKGFKIDLESSITNKDTMIIKYDGYIVGNELAGYDFSNDVVATWSNSPDYPDGTKTSATSNVIKPEIILEKSIDNGKKFNVGDTVDYTIVARIDNIKTPGGRANYLKIVDFMLTSGMELIPESIYVEEYAQEQYTVAIDAVNIFAISGINLNAGETLTIHYSAKITDNRLAGQVFNNEVVATCDNSSEFFKDEATGKVLQPLLTISKDIEFENYNYKDIANYIITVNQLTPTARANDIVVTDVIETEGVNLIPDSITVDGYNPSDYVVSATDINGKQGFVLKVDSISDELIIRYQAEITNKNLCGESFEASAAVISSNYLDDEGNTIEERASVIANVYEPELSIEKAADKYSYNLYDTVHFNVKVKQLVENAKAFGVVINDSFVNDGVEINPDTIKIDGYNTSDYSIEMQDNGYVVGFNVPLNFGEEINIEYDSTIVDPKLVDCILEHEIYTSCVTNTNTTGVWKDSVEIEVLKPDIMVVKTSNKIEAYANEKVHYAIEVSQTKENTNSFNLKVKDTIEDNMSIDMESITVSSSDVNIDFSSMSFEKTDNGFITYIPEIISKNSVIIEYDAIVLNENKDSSTNVVTVSNDNVDDIEAKATIRILERIVPETGESNTVAVAMAFGVLSLMIGTVLVARKKLRVVINVL